MCRGVLDSVREHNGAFVASMEACAMNPAKVFCTRIIVGFFESIEFLLELSYFSLQRRGVCCTEDRYWGNNGGGSVVHCSRGDNSVARMKVDVRNKAVWR